MEHVMKKRVIDLEEPIFETMFEHYPDTIKWLSSKSDGYRYLAVDCDVGYRIHSGEKILSKAIADYQDDINTIVDYIYNMYNKKWNHFFETLELDYNPLDSDYFERVEDGSNNRKSSHDNAVNETENVENKTSFHSLNDNSTISDTASKTYAFNSTDGVKNSQSNGENGGSSVAKGTNIDDNKISSLVHTLGTEKEFSNNTVKERYHGRRGVRPQDLLESEIEFRRKIFLDTVFDDVDKLITIGVY